MQLNYKTFGAGPPLVILHGLFGSLDNWQTLARRWADDYTVILVDLRNHGRSPHADEMSYPAMAEDVATFLEDRNVHACALLGHSMGGKVAMQTALTYPGLVTRLIVIDMAPRQYARGHDEVFDALRALDPAELTDRREADDLVAPYLPDPGVRMFLLKNLARREGQGFRWRMNLPVLYRDYDTLVGPVTRPGDPYPEPALFVRGGRSRYVRDEDLGPTRELFPRATLETIADVGHWLHAEAPDKLYGLVDNFLAT